MASVTSRWWITSITARRKLPGLQREFTVEGPQGRELIYFCIDCIAPEIHLYCNGDCERRYEKCLMHQQPHLEPQYDSQAHLLVAPDSAAAHQIWDPIGDEGMALLWARKLRFLSPKPVTPSAKDEKRTPSCLGEMLRPTKHHTGGCLHSSTPEIIISRSAEECNSQSAGTTNDASRLATDIYFKRCDGRYMNVRGEEIKA
jgi:hypothetical protein